MEKCFIIQPFDKGVYDKRYTDIFEPAINAAGVEPYRVDRDPGVKIPIDQIEASIKTSVICFAEITTDNPNVWYELGFAVASGKDVVLACSESERKGAFPFDIQHQHIITYKSTSRSDFDTLEKQITDKIFAFLQKQNTVKKIIDNPVKESGGLKPHEVTMMLILIENQFTSADSVNAISLRNDMNKAGFNNLAASIAIRELSTKGFIESFKEYDNYNNDEYTSCKITKLGEQWVLANQDKFSFDFTPQIEKTQNSKPAYNHDLKTIDDLPF